MALAERDGAGLGESPGGGVGLLGVDEDAGRLVEARPGAGVKGAGGAVEQQRVPVLEAGVGRHDGQALTARVVRVAEVPLGGGEGLAGDLGA